MLKLETYNNATLIPDSRGNSTQVRGGIYTQDKTFIKSSLLVRQKNTRPAFNSMMPVKYKKPKHKLYGHYVFGGYLFNHYGHAIIETLSRIWSMQHTPYPFIYTTTNKFVQGFSQLHYDLFKLINLPQPLYIDQPTEIENVTIPSMGVIIDNFIASEQINALSKFDANVYTMKHKTWVSRSLYKKGIASDKHTQDIIFQKQIEEKLSNHGWIIFHPHEHSLNTQLQTISESYFIAGFESSAFHSLILIKNYKGKVLMFNRGRSIPRIHFLIQQRLSLDWNIIDQYYPKNIDAYIKILSKQES